MLVLPSGASESMAAMIVRHSATGVGASNDEASLP